jgi:type IV pilus assembly protein PilV
MRANRQKGMSLIEVLVSILIFSVGILGLVALQMRATQASTDGEDRNRAALLANEAVSLIWTYQTVTLPTAVLASWQTRVGYTTTPTSVGLPSGVGTIATDTTQTPNVTTITIQWQEPSHPTVSQYVTSMVYN